MNRVLLIMSLVGVCAATGVGYLLVAPTPVEPVSWQAPSSEGLVGEFETNDELASLETFSLMGLHGPEGIAVDDAGLLYVSTHEGWILKFDSTTEQLTQWVNTGGRPLGLAFHRDFLIVADAYKGLLSVSPEGEIAVLTQQFEREPLLYVDDVDVASDGMMYFSDASSKFGAEAFGGTYPASLLDLMEHGGHGRLFRYDPYTDTTTLILAGLNFANGVAVDPNHEFVLVAETGSYQVLKVWLTENRFGETEILIDNLPGFPDNIVRGKDGRYWVGLASTRNGLLDSISDKPLLRKMVQRLPSFLRPSAAAYGHVFAIDENGQVLMSLQDPSGAYPVTTGAVEAGGFLYVSSLVAEVLGRRRVDF